jgi:putative tricarboxylic transport membrane protein
MRPLGITSEKRLPGIAVPTLKEQGVDVVLANWRAIFAAPGINDAQKKELIDAVGKAAKSATWRDILVKNEWADLYLPGDAFKTFLAAEQKQTEKTMTSLGLIK